MNKIPYDQIYKQFFSDPAMVKDLLLGFLDGDWLNELDFSTLQRLNSTYVTETLRERESDIIWKVQWKKQWIYLLILIEFQSTVDPFMVVRVLSYVSLLYQDVIKADKKVRKSRKLPPVLPLVLYNGDKPWNVPCRFQALFPDNLPKKLKEYQPEFSYWLLDEKRYKMSDEEQDNLVASLVALEQSRETSQMSLVVKRLAKLLKDPALEGLFRSYMVYFNRVLRKHKGAATKELENLGEVQQVLENIDHLVQRAEERGISQGISQGISEGISEGELRIVQRLLIKRFGSLTAEQALGLQRKSATELLELADRLLGATSADELIGH